MSDVRGVGAVPDAPTPQPLTDEFAPPEFWPPKVRAEREREHIEAILALPLWTLFRAGWLTPSGHVQGSTYYRIGGGCGPTSRDTDERQVLAVAARDTCYTTQPWAIEVLAEPAHLRAENGRLRAALCAAGFAPSTVDAIAEGEPPRPCPAGHGDQCCGYPAACEAALIGRSESDGSGVGE